MLHILQYIKNIILRSTLGVLELPEDVRDYTLDRIGWGQFKPQHDRLTLHPLDVKKQRNNTCAFNARVAGKEIDEGVRLSVPYLVRRLNGLGKITGDGFVDLRSVENAVVKFGVCEDRRLPEEYSTPWEVYADPLAVTDDMRENALKYQSQTFWAIKTLPEAWQALDNGRSIRFGVGWRTSMVKGMIAPPFILDFKSGFFLGGHALLVIGYDRNYYGEDVLICRNSFGVDYGDHGNIYIRVQDFVEQIKKYGAFCDLDLPKA